jgi:hypothetical protein
MRRIFTRRLLLFIPLIVVLALGGALVWLATPAGAVMAEAQAALVSDADVTVDSARWIVFAPTGDAPTVGFIFYPGAKVPPAAYAPAMRALAAEGYLAVIVPMPLNFAIFDIDAAAEVIAAYPDNARWAIGGHSLGGAMAANYAAGLLREGGEASALDGVILWGSYPQASDTLAGYDWLLAASIYGTRDGLASVEDIDGSRPYLPADAQFVAVEGGNHANFGWYGDQAGDLPATIPREDQTAQVVAATLAVLRMVERE